MIKIRELTLEDCETLQLHDKNIEEINKLYPAEIRDNLLNLCYNMSKEKYAVEDEKGNILCVLGMQSNGNFWLFFAKINKLPLSFYKAIKPFVKGLSARYEKVWGTVYIKNTFSKQLIIYTGGVIGNEKGDFQSFVIGGK